MKINKIQMRNFKGFENCEVAFNGNLTVAIGNNTAGKTTLLQAIQIALGAYLQSLKALPASKPFRRNFSESDRYLCYDPDKKDYRRNLEAPKITIEADITDTEWTNGTPQFTKIPVTWYREFTNANTTTHNAKCAGQLIDIVAALEHKREIQGTNAVLPIVLSFGTNRIDAQMRTIKKISERQQRIEKAYKAALIDQVDFAGALNWLNHYDKSIKDAKEFEGTREAFYEALATAIPMLSEIDLDQGELEAVVSIKGKTPERHHYSYMSDGIKAMINIVSEIAYRCIELNGFLGKDSVRLTPGVVLIDEVDLYVHPKWQQHILADLQKAFPNIQFIVTTHSPYIVQSLVAGQLISFDRDAIVDGAPFKESIEDISTSRMGMPQLVRSKRFNEMVTLAKNYFTAVDSGDPSAEDIKAHLDELQIDNSNDPGYIALMTYKSKKK